MKRFSFWILYLWTTTYLLSQEQFIPHIITASANGAQDVFAIDMDGDGDMDVLSASEIDDRIAWYENDGMQSFTTHNITVDADGASSTYAIDMDGDGDIDVLSASDNDDRIAWYENDGDENFSTHTITAAAKGTNSVFAIDLDSDGDVDVLSASFDDDKITWYENDGNENFNIHHIITSAADGAVSVFAIDLDDDSDVDILSASVFDDNISWYENDGNKNFTAHNITHGANFARSVYALDMDNDQDQDVVSASITDDRIVWYENDGNEGFTAQTITTGANGAISVYAIDIDSDSDIDVLSASRHDDRIAWYENDGNEDFTTHTISYNANEARSVFAIDLDGDGDTDVLSASDNDDKIAWYENIISVTNLNLVGRWTMIFGLDNEVPITNFDVELYFTEDSLQAYWKGGNVEPKTGYVIVNNKLIADYGGAPTFPGFLAPDEIDYAGVSIGLGDISVSKDQDTLTLVGKSTLTAASDDLISIRFMRKSCFIQTSLEIQHAKCYGDGNGSAMITVDSFTPPLTTNWSNGDTTFLASGLSPGMYQVTVQDDDQCTQSTSFTILEPNPLDVTLDSVSDDYGIEKGLIHISIEGGTPPYKAEWTGPGLYQSLNEDVNMLNAGWYLVKITDQNECKFQSDSIQIKDKSPKKKYINVNIDQDGLAECITSVKNSFSGSEIRVSPNPGTGLFTLRIWNLINENFIELKITNAMGQTVRTDRFKPGVHFTRTVNLQSFPKGTYLLTLSGKHGYFITYLILV